ncbi:low affinity immunoglobulin epsilon Fc receptor-like [Ostrea edulis]|uniref:low affinity immunoglobulin epsilon Fc receptor-like n=1 Tax=Ostrea edulis TaxID=37623 RepID=UPI0024AEC1D9|nr:low affinity immunoglobulin epsilon Fc receptor-like [Ostrea edulis]
MKLLSVLLFIGFTSCHGCNVGWIQFQDKCYLFSHTLDSWADAAGVCSVFHSKLAEPRTAAESKFLISHSQSQGGNFWIGISDIIEEGRWEYSDQTVITVNDFSPGEPDQHTTGNCVILWQAYHGRWGDHICSILSKFICETDVILPGSHLIG